MQQLCSNYDYVSTFHSICSCEENCRQTYTDWTAVSPETTETGVADLFYTVLFNGEKDITSKTLEAFDDVFADIVNGLLFKGEQVVQEQSLVDAQPYSMYKSDGKTHEQERDVSKYWAEQSGEQINIRAAFPGVENQSAYDKDMPLRVIGYDGAAYRAELG